MALYSFIFFGFFALFSLLFQFSAKSEKQILVLLLANIVFYAYWDYRFLFLLFGMITVTYACACLFDKTKKNIWITIGVVIALATLGVFKYFDFFSATFSKAFGLRDTVTLNLILPLGISFYIFQILSYLLDLRKGSVTFDGSYLKLAAYISFFPQITSGPIVKAHDFLPQLERRHRITGDNLCAGVQLFLTGLTKKLVFADRIGVAVDAVFAAPDAYDGVSILFAVIGYALQIYFDFSGYSDMAIGIAKIWDFDLGKNFNAPYLAANPSDFWGRWHISLSSWFKEYVYIPLGGNRKGKLRTYINLMITMLLSGIWHGASMTFVVWGAIHGLGSVVNKLFRVIRGNRSGSCIVNTVSTLINCCFVAFAWVIFRAPSLTDAAKIFAGLTRTTGIRYISVFTVCYAILIGGVLAWSKYRNNGNILTVRLNLKTLWGKALLAAWIFAIVSLMYVGNSAFIYAQF